MALLHFMSMKKNKIKNTKIQKILLLVITLFSVNFVFFIIYLRNQGIGMGMGIEFGEIIYILPILFSYIIGILVYFIIKNER